MRSGTGERRWARVAVAAIGLFCGACGDDEPTQGGAPVGEPVLPDLVPEAPTVLHTKRDPSGNWSMRFSSTLVNVGEGDFVLVGDRSDGSWAVEQAIAYTEGGAKLVPTAATGVWGGDGHSHWHIERVATYRLERSDESGTPVAGAEGRSDTKVGFCFFDSHKRLDRGPEEAQFSRDGCGKEDDNHIDMGLSPGWGDVYDFTLPGQSVDISELPDGRYRLWAEADPQGWFREVTRENNVTWVDLELSTGADGVRTAMVVSTGAQPE